MQWITSNWFKVVAIIMVLGAVASIPYFAYYQLMNWVVAVAALITAWQSYKQGNMWFVWIMGALAVVFNPLAPIYLSANAWQVADLIAALLFVASFFFVRPRAI